MKSKVNDCLKYWRVIRYFIKQKYGLTTADLDMLLFLYSEDIFSKEKFEEFFSIHLDCPEVETLGGFMLKEIGHLPKVGEKIQVDYLEMIVTSADQRKIKKITVRKVE